MRAETGEFKQTGRPGAVSQALASAFPPLRRVNTREKKVINRNVSWHRFTLHGYSATCDTYPRGKCGKAHGPRGHIQSGNKTEKKTPRTIKPRCCCTWPKRKHAQVTCAARRARTGRPRECSIRTRTWPRSFLSRTCTRAPDS